MNQYGAVNPSFSIQKPLVNWATIPPTNTMASKIPDFGENRILVNNFANISKSVASDGVHIKKKWEAESEPIFSAKKSYFLIEFIHDKIKFYEREELPIY